MPRVKRVYGVRLMAPNTVSGNPRRSWIVFDAAGFFVDCIDEGYTGESVFRDKYAKGVPLMSVSVTAKAYRQHCLYARGMLS